MADKSAKLDEETADGTFASPPCYMHEIDPAYAGLVVDPCQARDVARWRKVERQRLIAPLVGFDPDGYRLGYGGGFFDRTLAAQVPRPLAIGVGHPVGALPTIYPQPHDIPMDWVVTGDEAPAQRQARAP
jgi:5,10-methenyltetrahydrofolate synthetase